MVTLGLINPLGIGAHARYGSFFGAGLDVQFMPAIGRKGVSVSWASVNLGARVYPFGGSFWVGAGLGYQGFTSSASSATGGSVEGSVRFSGVNLGLGWMGKSGLVFGFDLGLLLPLAGVSAEIKTVQPGSNPDDASKLRVDVKDAAELVTGIIPFIPQINMIRVGYLF